MKTGLIIRHTPYEGIAGFREPVEAAGFVMDRIDVADPAFGAVDFVAPDLLVLMGGSMGVYDTDAHPWIAGEIAGLRRRLAAARPTLAVCLGAQMVAAALGSRVFPGPKQEIGFAPIILDEAGSMTPLRHLAGVPVLHWHGDTFDLPPEVERLASTSLYCNQGFRRGKWLLALQFHAEMGEDQRFEDWLAGGAADMTAAGKDAAALRADHARFGPRAAAAGREMIAEWLAGLERSPSPVDGRGEDRP